MSDRSERFRRLARRRKAGGGAPTEADGEETTGDLFQHFGIALERAPAEVSTPAVEAAPCRRCGWLLAYRRAERACEVCAEPDPLTGVE